MRMGRMLDVALAIGCVLAAGAALAGPPGSGYGAHDEGTTFGTSGLATGTSGTTYGGYFLGTASPNGYGSVSKGSRFGAFGQAQGATERTFGGYFVSDSSSGWGAYTNGGAIGIYGHAVAASGTTYGGFMDCASSDGYGLYARGGRYGVYAKATASAGTTYGIRARADSPDGYAGYFDGNVMVSGNFYVLGTTKNCVVRMEDGSHRAMYAVESPESWFEDFGVAQLKDGLATVKVPADFAQTVNTLGAKYLVFLTPRGDCKGLYAAKQSPDCFEVRELAGGTSNIEFCYRVVAKPLGNEKLRMKSIRIPKDALGPDEPELPEASLPLEPEAPEQPQMVEPLR